MRLNEGCKTIWRAQFTPDSDGQRGEGSRNLTWPNSDGSFKEGKFHMGFKTGCLPLQQYMDYEEL